MKTKEKTAITYKGANGLMFKLDTESKKVSGYLAAFNNKDSDGDILVPGCFAKSIQEHGPESISARKIAFCWQHDITDPIGKFTKLVEDDKGLYFEAVIDDVENGERALKQYASGTLNQHSIGYRYVWDKMRYDEEKEAFMVGEVILFEGSVVTIGANENTPFTGMKAESIATQNDELLKETELFIKNLDQTIGHTIRQITQKWFALGQAKPETEQKESTKPAPEPETKKIDLNKVKQLITNKI